jgi:hypothetical protein
VVVLGLGLSILVPTLTTVAMSSVSSEHSGLASGINNAFSRSAGLLAIAVLGVVMFVSFSGALDARAAKLDLGAEAQQQLEESKSDLGAAQPPEGLASETAAAVERAVAESFLLGFRVVMLVAAGLAVASAVAAAVMIEGGRAGDGPVGEPASEPTPDPGKPGD